MRRVVVDTAGPVVGVAAWVGDDLVFVASERIVHRADAWLGPALADALRAAGGVDEVGVTTGPGAFTGLRVGVATALGLAVARGVRVVALSSLALRAAAGARALGAGGGAPVEVLAMLDARKDRVYAGRFTVSDGVPHLLGDEADVPPAEAIAGFTGFATGEGSLVYAPLLHGAGIQLAPEPDATPVSAALPLLTRARGVEPAAVGLHYLRPPDAQPRPT